jgi:phenylacetate-coenzyme A ligase PaaK-like adenylate-forming protein
MKLNSIIKDLVKLPIYEIAQKEKSELLFKEIEYLTQYHIEHCEQYASFIRTFIKSRLMKSITDIPFFSVRAFKEFELCSVSKEKIFKTMTSSGTTGQAVSKIYLDRETASLQSTILTRLMREVTGAKRIPMLIIDTPSIVKSRQSFSARGAGIIGFSFYGKDITFALNEDNSLNFDKINTFFDRNRGKQVFIFGFTFMVWKHFLKNLTEFDISVNNLDSVLLHGGGWKKLTDEAVSSGEFKLRAKEMLGITKVVNYYGLIEQTGSLYFECEHGHLHPSIFSDVIVRCPRTLCEVPLGVEGVVQVLSCIPRSYPGHSLLTDDLGVVYGIDNCDCGRKGKYFSINGRLQAAEVRGCSDAIT